MILLIVAGWPSNTRHLRSTTGFPSAPVRRISSGSTCDTMYPLFEYRLRIFSVAASQSARENGTSTGWPLPATTAVPNGKYKLNSSAENRRFPITSKVPTRYGCPSSTLILRMAFPGVLSAINVSLRTRRST